MGCVSSKQPKCRHCKSQYSPKRHSTTYLDHWEHDQLLSQSKSESFHVVALTSSTLGSFRVDFSGLTDPKRPENGPKVGLKEQLEEGIIEAKAWSNTIKIPKTPIRTPYGEPEMIDALELMKGLEDISPFRSPSHIIRSLSLELDDVPNPSPSPENLGFGPEEVKEANERVVVYFTSLRGVRKTYEDCCDTMVILKGIGVRIDERDMSMHSGFKEELKELLRDRVVTGNVLPRVFIGRRYIGGAEEIRRMHEQGLLEKELEGCEMVGSDGCGNVGCCEGCGDVRFVPCETFSGSCKIYLEDEKDEHEENDDHGNYGGEVQDEEEEEDCGLFKRCPDCNENGLIKCPMCCS